jgi:isopenicillin N synthase-like dioxygenase
MTALPVVDLGAFFAAEGKERREIARNVDEICKGTGFLLVAGHGVPEAVIAGVRDAAARFFAQPLADKAKVAAPYPGYPYGWLGPLSEALARSKGEETPPDLKESFNGGPLAVPEGMTDPEALAFCYQPTLWPDVPGFRAAWEAYYREMEALAARIMRLFAVALELPEGYFDPVIGQPISALRALNYPATTAAPEDRQQRAGAHTDYGSLTILLPQDGSRGLEIWSGEWVEVVPVPGCFVINIGDLMARWTADRWVSTLHRVMARPGQAARQSLAFFHQPDWAAEIRPLDGSEAYPPVLSGPYLMNKFKATGA